MYNQIITCNNDNFFDEIVILFYCWENDAIISCTMKLQHVPVAIMLNFVWLKVETEEWLSCYVKDHFVSF